MKVNQSTNQSINQSVNAPFRSADRRPENLFHKLPALHVELEMRIVRGNSGDLRILRVGSDR